jgi:hypothetical protein
MFRRPDDEEGLYFIPVPLRARLPRIEIPLRSADKPAVVDLQSLVDQVCESGRYRQRIDYTAALDPPLNASDTAWAHDLIEREGRGTRA